MYETFASYPQQLSYVFKTDAWLAPREDANDPPPLMIPQSRQNSNRQCKAAAGMFNFVKTFLWLLHKLQVFQTVYSDLSDAETKENLRTIDAKTKLRESNLFCMDGWT